MANLLKTTGVLTIGERRDRFAAIFGSGRGGWLERPELASPLHFALTCEQLAAYLKREFSNSRRVSLYDWMSEGNNPVTRGLSLFIEELTEAGVIAATADGWTLKYVPGDAHLGDHPGYGVVRIRRDLPAANGASIEERRTGELTATARLTERHILKPGAPGLYVAAAAVIAQAGRAA